MQFLDDRERMKEAWRRVVKDSAPSYFLSCGWIENWLNHLPANVPLRLAVTGTSALFLGETTLTRKSVFHSRALFLNATGRSEHDDLCIEYNAIPGKTSSLSELLERLPDGWEEFHLPGLDAAAFPGNALPALTGYTVLVDKDVPSPYVDLEAVRHAKGDYLSLLSANTRSQVRRSYRGFGDVTMEIATGADHALAIYEELVQLHQQSWQARGKSGAFASDWFSQFHRDLIRKRFESGEIQLLRVLAGKETLGCLYNFIWRGRVYFYQSGFPHESDAKLKPGLVAHAEAVRHNAERGLAEYDFLGGEARYKSSLATNARRLVWARIQTPRAKFWIESRLRQVKHAIQA